MEELVLWFEPCCNGWYCRCEQFLEMAAYGGTTEAAEAKLKDYLAAQGIDISERLKTRRHVGRPRY
jgi:hypothetical protein